MKLRLTFTSCGNTNVILRAIRPNSHGQVYFATVHFAITAEFCLGAFLYTYLRQQKPNKHFEVTALMGHQIEH